MDLDVIQRPWALATSVKLLDEGEPPGGVSMARKAQCDSSKYSLDFLSVMCLNVGFELEDDRMDVDDRPPSRESAAVPYEV